MIALYTEDPKRVTDPPELICRGSERACRRAAAEALGVDSLRGLYQAPTDTGTAYYGPGGDDYVEICCDEEVGQ